MPPGKTSSFSAACAFGAAYRSTGLVTQDRFEHKRLFPELRRLIGREPLQVEELSADRGERSDVALEREESEVRAAYIEAAQELG